MALSGLKRNEILKKCVVTTLHSDDIYADNVPHTNLVIAPETIKPVTNEIELNGQNMSVTIPAKTFVVYRLYR